jgi:hypothetical protein
VRTWAVALRAADGDVPPATELKGVVVSEPEKSPSPQQSSVGAAVAATGDPAGGWSETALVREGGIAIRAR